ncbi:MAG: spore photoproduct lyase family protein [Candidatus Omnitrophota bacterium]
MRVYKNEFERLKKIRAFVKQCFKQFGVNKIQELTRLLYEISKRENVAVGRIFYCDETVEKCLRLSTMIDPAVKPQDDKNGVLPQDDKSGILPQVHDKSFQPNYDSLKKYLLARRYPYASLHEKSIQPYLPKIELNISQKFNIKEKEFYPKNIFIEKGAQGSFLASRIRNLFPRARVLKIESLKGYVRGKVSPHPNPLPQGEREKKGEQIIPLPLWKRFSPQADSSTAEGEGDKIIGYNNRRDSLFIVNEKYDFFKRCPCTKLAIGCGYNVFNLGFGCVFDCTYCFLQDYANFPGIVLPANIGSFFDRFSSYSNARMRIGTGEFSDSLALDDITGYAPAIIEFFRKHKKAIFEFKTKSVNVENLLKTAQAGNIVVSWSLNPQKIIDDNEFFTPSLKQRINAACKCVQAGYKVGFHFDPVIYFSGWENEYAKLLDELFNKIKPKYIAWISLGSFRFRPTLKTVIEKRFPANMILDEELLPGYDQKLRYPYSLRLGVYKKMLDMFIKHGAGQKVYLCMEDMLMWKDLKIKMPKFF